MIDRLRELRTPGVFGLSFGEKAAEPNKKHVNVRAQLYEYLQNRLARGDISLPDDQDSSRN